MTDRDRELEGDPDVPTRGLMEQVNSAAEAARPLLAEGSKRIRAFVSEKPVQALGIAFGVGVVIGWLIKRR